MSALGRTAVGLALLTAAALGLAGSVGFLYLLGRLISRRTSARPRLQDGLTLLTLFGLLLGMVGGLGQSLDVFGLNSLSHRSPIPNLFLVGDTVFPGQGVAGVTQSELIAANELDFA